MCESRYSNQQRQNFRKYVTLRNWKTKFSVHCSESENLTLAHTYTCQHKICACTWTINCIFQIAQTCRYTVHVHKYRKRDREELTVHLVACSHQFLNPQILNFTLLLQMHILIQIRHLPLSFSLFFLERTHIFSHKYL